MKKNNIRENINNIDFNLEDKRNKMLAIFIAFILIVISIFIYSIKINGAITSGKSGILVGQSLGKGGDGKYYLDDRTADGIRHATKVKISGVTYTGYCINHGLKAIGGTGYKTYSTSASKYTNLPTSAKKWLPTVLVRGYHSGKSSLVSGTTSSDYYMATQVLIWNFTQGYLSSPTGSLKSSSVYNIIKGRSAEKVYKQLIKDVEGHLEGGSFMSTTAASSKTYKLKYNYAKKVFELPSPLVDTNKNGVYKAYELDSLKMTRSGYNYYFSSTKAITSNIVGFTNDYKTGTSQSMLIAQPTTNFSTHQGLAFGATDSSKFYAKFITEKVGRGKIIKTSENGHIEGFEFEIIGNGYNKKIKTDSKGIIDLDLYPGTYTVKEILSSEQIPNYVQLKSQQIIIKEGVTSTLNFKNIPIDHDKFSIIKSTEDGSSVEGYRFNINGVESNGKVLSQESILSNASISGNASPVVLNIEDLETVNMAIIKGETGKYPIRLETTEKSIEEPTEENPTPEPIEEPVSLTINIYLHHVDSKDNDVCDTHGTIFTAKDFNYEGSATLYDKDFVTDENGMITDKDIKAGTYVATEIMTEEQLLKFKKPESQSFTLSAENQSATLYFENKIKKGNLKIVKVSEDKIVEGIEFIITGKNVMGEEIIPIHCLTNEEGVIVEGLENLIAGTYYIEEVVDESKYQKQDVQIVEIKDGEIIEVPFYNRLKTGEIDFSKVDSITGLELEGAKLQILEKDTEKIVDEWMSENKPHKVKLEIGKEYIFREITAPLGYLLSKDIIFTAGDEKIITMLDEAIHTNISKLDIDTKKPIAGSTLEVIDPITKEVISKWKSTKEVNTLYGLEENKTYILHEAGAPKGYGLAKDVEFIATNGQEVSIADKKIAEIDKGKKGPKTGDKSRFILFIIIIMCVALTTLFMAKTREEKK